MQTATAVTGPTRPTDWPSINWRRFAFFGGATTLNPFAALRPKPELASQICELPYDVMSSDEARAIAAGNPLSFLHVSKPEIDLPPATVLTVEEGRISERRYWRISGDTDDRPSAEDWIACLAVVGALAAYLPARRATRSA